MEAPRRDVGMRRLLPRILLPDCCHTNGSRRVPIRRQRSSMVTAPRAEVSELATKPLRNLSAPRVIRTPDLLIRRTVRACRHPTTIGHSTAHNLTSDLRISACPSLTASRGREAFPGHTRALERVGRDRPHGRPRAAHGGARGAAHWRQERPNGSSRRPGTSARVLLALTAAPKLRPGPPVSAGL